LKQSQQLETELQKKKRKGTKIKKDQLTSGGNERKEERTSKKEEEKQGHGLRDFETSGAIPLNCGDPLTS